VLPPPSFDAYDDADRWRVLLARFQLSSDFQQLELFKLTEARLAQNGVTFPQMQQSMEWQVEVGRSRRLSHAAAHLLAAPFVFPLATFLGSP